MHEAIRSHLSSIPFLTLLPIQYTLSNPISIPKSHTIPHLFPNLPSLNLFSFLLSFFFHDDFSLSIFFAFIRILILFDHGFLDFVHSNFPSKILSFCSLFLPTVFILFAFHPYFSFLFFPAAEFYIRE